MTNLKPKVGIIGCGNVGMRYAYALIMRGLARSLVITDIDKKHLEGEVLDLSHGAPYISPVDIIGGDYPDLEDADLVVVTAGKKQNPGQTRLDLAKDNVEIYRQIIPQIIKYAPSAILLIATNPVDIMSYAAYKFSAKPPQEVIGSGTVLDTARFRFALAQHCKIDPRNAHAYILGEHGDSEFPVWSNAMLGGVLFKNFCSFCENKQKGCKSQELDNIFKEVKESAYRIIQRKGETSYAIGLSLVRITQAVLHNENAVLPVSSLINGYFGIDDLFLSLPAIINRNGVRQILPLELSAEEEKQLKDSASAIKEVIKQTGLSS